MKGHDLVVRVADDGATAAVLGITLDGHELLVPDDSAIQLESHSGVLAATITVFVRSATTVPEAATHYARSDGKPS